MGLEKQIERIFQRAMESDLELIAQDVSADGNTTPQGSCMCACGITATISSNDTPLEEQLYSIRRIVFEPLKDFWEIVAERIRNGQEQYPGPHSESLQDILQQLKEAPDKSHLDNKVAGLVSVLAHHYRDEGPSVTIVPRSKERVISLGVLDYLSKDCLEDLEELKEENLLHFPDIE